MGEAANTSTEDENPLQQSQPNPTPAVDMSSESKPPEPSVLDEAKSVENTSITASKTNVSQDGNSPNDTLDALGENQGDSSTALAEATPNALLDRPPEQIESQKENTENDPAETLKSVDEDSAKEQTEKTPEDNTAISAKPAVQEKRKLTTRRETANQEDLKDAFDDFKPRRGLKRKKASARSETKIAIRLSHNGAEEEKCTQENESDTQPSIWEHLSKEIWWDEMDEYNYHDDETFMEFYHETHEEQSQSYQAFLKQKKEDEIRLELRKLEQKDREGRAAIERILADQMEEKKQQADRNINKYVQRVQQEEKRDHQKLKGLYQQRLEANQQKVTNSMKILQRRQQKEMQAAAQSHQQRVQQQQIPEHIASAEWQSVLRQLQGKHQRQQQEFKKKADELKQKTDADYSREEQKIRNQHETKIKDAEKSRQKLAAKLVSHFQQVRQRYLKRHIQRVVKDRNDLTKSADESKKKLTDESEGRKAEKTSTEEKAEFNPPLPIKSQQPWVEESPYEPSGAASRHKHRKGVMSQTRRQLSIEIHNEGIWVTILKTEEDDKRGGAFQSSSVISSTGASIAREEFIPWGIQAYDFLESIVCGEIPTIFERTRSFRDTEATQGGQVRCILADLRVSEEVASFQRALAAREREELGIEELEKRHSELSKIASEVERQVSIAESEEKECRNAAESTTKEVAKARRCQDEFRSKFRNYLGPDGNPLQTTNLRDRQELMKATVQYKNMLEKATRREQAIAQKLAEIKAKVHKLQNSAKTAMRNATVAADALKKKKASMADAQQAPGSQSTKLDIASNVEKTSIGIKETVEILKRTAEKRREQAHQKQTNSFTNSGAQMFPELPMSLRKSIWHKMHRRKQQIILRPTEESLINELRSTTQEILSSKIAEKSMDGLSSSERQHVAVEKMRKLAGEEKELIKAEQLFLLAMHPAATEELAVVPPAKSSDAWGEPGWQLSLDVPKDEYRANSILPRAQTFPIFEQQYSEKASAPGRQAASLLKTSHLRFLALPQSLFSIASSPAEPATAAPATQPSTYGDPLHLSEEDIRRGYTFSVRQLSPPTSTPAKRKSQTASDRQASTSSQKKKAATTPATTSVPPSMYPPAPSTLTSAVSKNTKAKATATTKPQPKKRRPPAVKAPAPSPRTQKKKDDTATTNRRPSQTGTIPMMPYPYGQPPRQMSQPQPTSQRGQSQQQQQYTPQQMAQFRMMQQQQQAAGSNQNYQQQPFFPPGLTPQQMQQMQARHQHMMQQPGQPQQQTQQQQPAPSRNPNDNNDPLFMLK